MPILQVGATEIPYRIRHSTAAKRKRIVVTPEEIEVVAPEGQGAAEIAEFMHAKRRWVYDKREELLERTVDNPFPTHFATGGKVLYRGCRLRLLVEATSVAEVEIEYRNGFHVVAPARLDEAARDAEIGRSLAAWMKARMHADAEAFLRRHAPRLGVAPAGLRIKDQRHLWGSCGNDGVIRLNWHLVFAPKPVLEYAVVHELCHLRHRNHSAAFWQMVGTTLPEFERTATWLNRQEGWQLCLDNTKRRRNSP